MPIICREHDLIFTHVPKAAGTFVSRALRQTIGGDLIRPKHLSYRRAQIDGRFDGTPSIRVFAVRDPVSWYKSYWAWARASMTDARAWPIWLAGDVRHPTLPLDQRCGHHDFAEFVRNSLREFPNGFLRSLYCEFLNGSTHALRCEQLRDDVEKLLKIVGYPEPEFVQRIDDANVNAGHWKSRAVLPRRLEESLREVENLDGLAMPYV